MSTTQQPPGGPSNKAPAPQVQSLSLGQKWTTALQKVRRPVQSSIVQVAMLAARNPWMTIAIACLLSVGLVVIGLFTNITFESDDGVLFTPFNAIPSDHQKWINEESDFPALLREQNILMHNKGANIMEDCRGCVSKAFDVLETLEGLEGFGAICQTSKTNDPSCPWSGITQFFNNSRQVYEDANFQSNEDCLAALSIPFFPNGELVLTTKIFGFPTFDEATSIMTSAQSIFFIMGFPPDEDIEDAVVDLETKAIDALVEVAEKWEKDGTSPFTILEQFNESSFPLEFGRGFLQNIPFLAAAFTLMSVFTAAIFFSRDPVQSRMVVGLGATVTVTLAMAAG
eukprot:CAMPEP_0176486070 /NCGR_PEP_ID=MMETSP0200_2-20121128/5374_1 /TAXON_ID=947934 /ORGANISM="Chaetoceros sp., Strain GSL56" /LENGTH=340 /DNA_ID=CAMNT_0017882751 /DNA_START=1970 /DNA_END=2989 /DNA_ORIENTATION=+